MSSVQKIKSNISRTGPSGIKTPTTSNPSSSISQQQHSTKLPKDRNHRLQSDGSQHDSALKEKESAHVDTESAGSYVDTQRAGLEKPSEEELFRRAVCPPDIEGIQNWGIPDEVDPNECPPSLTVWSLQISVVINANLDDFL